MKKEDSKTKVKQDIRNQLYDLIYYEVFDQTSQDIANQSKNS